MDRTARRASEAVTASDGDADDSDVIRWSLRDPESFTELFPGTGVAAFTLGSGNDRHAPPAATTGTLPARTIGNGSLAPLGPLRLVAVTSPQALGHNGAEVAKRAPVPAATHAYAGRQSVVVQDSAQTGLDSTVRLRKDEVLDNEAVLVSKIVDSPGRRG